MPRQFKTKKGTTTNIFNSYNYYRTRAKRRSELPFDKKFLGGLSQRDKDLLRGYGQRIVEEQQSFKYHNPDYRRKTNSAGF